MAFDPRFYEGVETFNRRSFFEAHQIWESVWMHYRGPSRRLTQGADPDRPGTAPLHQRQHPRRAQVVHFLPEIHRRLSPTASRR